ncbi:MAG: DUF3418 domain-containing protein, partial [Gammaproteobacteria bacterium]
YDEHIPHTIYSGAQFEQWYKQQDKQQTEQLKLQREALMQHDAAEVTRQRYPDVLEFNGNRFPLEYHFDPQHHQDGVTLITPVSALQSINAQRCEWLVPGLLEEKITALIRSLPKQLRRNFVPAPDFARVCAESLQPADVALPIAIGNQLKKMTGVEIPYDAWRLELLDEHLLMNFRVIGQHKKVLAEGRHLQQLKEQFADETRLSPASTFTRHPLEQDDVSADVLGDIPEQVDIDVQGVRMKAWPALSRNGNKVALRLFASRAEAELQQYEGLRQLFSNALNEQIRHLRSQLPGIQQLCLQYASIGKCDDLKQDIITFIIDQLFTRHPVSSPEEFQTVVDAGRSQMFTQAKEVCTLLGEILGIYQQLRKSLKHPPLAWLDAINDMQEQLQQLIHTHFLLTTDPQWLQHYPRYLKGIQKRLDKLQDNPQRDRQNRLIMHNLWDNYRQRAQHARQQHIRSPQLDHYRWMLEEYRISLFAQELKTLFPISDKRLKDYWNNIADA